MESAYYEDDKHENLSSRRALGRLLPLLKPHTRWLLVCLLLLAGSKAIYLMGPNLIRRAIDVDITNRDYGACWRRWRSTSWSRASSWSPTTSSG